MKRPRIMWHFEIDNGAHTSTNLLIIGHIRRHCWSRDLALKRGRNWDISRWDNRIEYEDSGVGLIGIFQNIIHRRHGHGGRRPLRRGCRAVVHRAVRSSSMVGSIRDWDRLLLAGDGSDHLSGTT